MSETMSLRHDARITRAPSGIVATDMWSESNEGRYDRSSTGGTEETSGS